MFTYDFSPMEPVSWPAPFVEPGWVFQVKWDGVRMLTLWEKDLVRLVNRKGADRTNQYPEIAGLRDVFPAGTVIDGEFVVLAQGKPKFDLILKRDQRRQIAAIHSGAQQWPVLYAVFDLLYWRGQDIRSWPLSRRQSTLASLWPNNYPQLYLVESFAAGEELFAAVGSAGLEGIVAKRLQSRYVPGKQSSDWRKIKHWRYVNCVVGGYTLRAGMPSALLLGLYSDEGLVYVGRAGSGLSNSDWQAINGYLQAATSAVSPFLKQLSIADRVVRWVIPLLAVRIKFMEWSSDLKLRAPVILGFQSATRDSCSFNQQGV